MLIDPHALEWSIPPKEALRWVDEPAESYLVKDTSNRTLSQDRLYFPAENAALFHRFATTEPTKEGVLAFAQKFGFLGAEYGDLDDYQIDGTYHWEKFSHWKGELKQIQIAYSLWRALKKNDETALHSIFSAERLRGLPRLNIQQNAWRKIEHHTTDALERLIFAIVPDFNFAFESELTGLSLKFRPSSLISLIWLQFAQAASAIDRWQICDYCGEPFKPESMKARYCSDSHRQMAYRKRKEARP